MSYTMVEFKLDERTNKPVLIEVNPRFWGSINQAIASGVDFPYLLYKMTIDGDIKPVLTYELGVKTRILLGDIRALFTILKRNKNIPYVVKELLRTTNCDEIAFDNIFSVFLLLYRGVKEIFNKEC